MAEAQYIPANTDFAGTFFGAANAAQSFMARRQQMRDQQEDREYQKRQRELTEPVYAAQREAAKATALSTLETFKQQQNLKRRFAQEAPIANAEYQAAMALPTFQEQQMALMAIQPKYSWMSLLDEGKPFVDQMGKSRGYTFEASLADAKSKADLAEIQARNNAMKEQIALRGQNDLAVAKATGRGLTPVQRYMQARDDFIAAGDEQGASTMQAMIDKAQRSSTITAGETIEDLNRRATAARAAGNLVLAKQLEDKAVLLTTRPQIGSAILDSYFGGESPVATSAIPAGDAPTTPPAAPAPAAPASTNLFEGITY